MDIIEIQTVDLPGEIRYNKEEIARIQAAEKSGFVAEEDVDWNHLSKYDS